MNWIAEDKRQHGSLHFSVAVLLTTCLLACAGTAPPSAPAPPNVVLIIGDDQAWTDFGFMGHPEIRTPHLDRLADQSLCFTRGYVPSPLCRPSLSSIVTGLYPHQHGVTSNDPPPEVDRSLMLSRIQQVQTLPRQLAARGYRSLQTGKWWEGHHSLGGFTEGMTHGDPARGGRHGDDGLTIGREGLQPVFDFIDDCESTPFFVWYAPFLPHVPHNPPERLLQKYQTEGRSEYVARYWAMCEWFDETCGELLQFLDSRDLRDNTLVIYVSDNGWIQQENGASYAARSKRSPYDGGLRTPVLLRWPSRLKPHRDDTTLVTSLDLAPTILSACDIQPELPLPGRNLLDEEAAVSNPRNTIFGEVFTHDAVDLDVPAASLLHQWCIEDWLKLIVPGTGGQPAELYDLLADPHETKNLARAHPDQVRRLQEKIVARWPATGTGPRR